MNACIPVHSLWRRIWIGYCIASILLFLYSFTQVDLGLTIVDFSVWQVIQKQFQHVGYFQRPLSTGLYIVIVGFLFILYGISLHFIRKGTCSKQALVSVILWMFPLLIFSYPAFSYDFFNYMFTAKTVLIYHKNPFSVVPLNFTGFEPWLSFMHWTHLPSAYSPLWILFSLPPYLLGFGYFLGILWSMKWAIGLFYLLTAYGIWRISKKEQEKDRLFSVALFALNPLILVESLVSGHNDIVMSGLGMMALMYLYEHRNITSFFFWALSVAMKEITIILFPLYLCRALENRWIPFTFMTAGLLLFLLGFHRELLPWYGVWIIPFAAVVPNPRFLVPIIFGLSIGLLSTYVPYLYLGNWNGSVKTVMFWSIFIPIFFSFLLTFGQFLNRRFQKGVL